MSDHLVLLHKDDGYLEKLRVIKQVKCEQCGSDDLDIYEVENGGMECTQAYQCRKCKHVGTFGECE